MTKHNLVIIHSFPTNSLILAGLHDFLSDTFNVYPIDLPGFIYDKEPFSKISFEMYRNYVEQEIDRLRLNSYILSGVSFGFAVANYCRVDDQCKGFLALEPYINKKYLRMDNKAIFFMKGLLSFISKTRAHDRVYNGKLFQRFLYGQTPSKHVDIMKKNVDGFTFFETAKMLLNHSEEINFKSKPHALIINEQDETIDGMATKALFQDLDDVLILDTTCPHYPKSLTKRYFRQHISPKQIQQVVGFFSR